MTATSDLIQKIYIGYFGRAGDPAGLNYWVERSAGGMSDADIAQSFSVQDEATEMYGFLAAPSLDMGRVEFLNSVYQNLFGRDMDAEGEAYWLDQLDNGRPVGGIILDIINGARNTSAGQDLTVVTNKLAVANYYTESVIAANTNWTLDDDQADAIAVIDGVTSSADTVTASKALADTLVAADDTGLSIELTTTIDNIAGSAFEDTITAVLGNSGYYVTVESSGGQTWTALDSINGGAGSDTMNVLDLGQDLYDSNTLYTTGNSIPAGTLVTSVETINIRAAADVGVIAGQTIESFDVSDFTGLTSLNVIQAVNVNVTAGEGTAVSVSGTTGDSTLTGGASQTVTSGTTVTASGSVGAVAVSGVTGNISIDDGTSVTVTDTGGSNFINIGHTLSPTGAVIVSDTNLGTGNIQVDGGTDVTITAASAKGGHVVVGANYAPSGVTSITVTGTKYIADATVATTLGIVNATGGTAVTVDVTATSSAAAAAKGTTNSTLAVTQGAITVVGDKNTTTVTVSQDADVTAVDYKAATAAAAGVQQVDTVTFVAMLANETMTVDGLTFTASVDLTAAQVASAFANLDAGATQGSAAASLGTYSGAFGTSYTTGAASSSKVTATAVDAVTGNTAITVTDTTVKDNVSSANTTEGLTAVKAVAAVDGVMGITAGFVNIDGALVGDDVLTTVSIDGYGPTAQNADSQVVSDALTSLTLANSKNGLGVWNGAAETLALSLNNIGTGSTINLDAGGALYTTLNITTTGAASHVSLTAAAVETLTVAGTKTLDLTGATLTALETVTVSGSAGLTIDASGANVTTVSTAATTGDSTITVDADKATFTGGSGKDAVTLSSTTVDKAVSLAGGDDSLTLAAGTTAVSSTLSGGLGTDTLVMDAADADALSGSTAFGAKIDGFEKLSIGEVAAGVSATVDLANLDGISYVVSAGTAVGVTGSAEFQTLEIGNSSVKSSGTITVGGVQVSLVQGNIDTDIAVAISAALNAEVGATPIGNAKFLPTMNNSAIVRAYFDANDGNVSDTTLAVVDTNLILLFPVSGIVIDKQGTNSVAAGTLAVTNMANDGTLELTGAADTITVTMEDATGAADSFNIITKVSTADLDFGTVDVQDVETVTITATDTSTKASIELAILELVGDAETVVVTGNAGIDLISAITALKTVDASGLTGNLTFTSGVASATITGGDGDDTINGTGNSQHLTGGDGDDYITASGAGLTISGDDGDDEFYVIGDNQTISAGDGDDVIYSYGDSAILTGGAGDDLFDIDYNSTLNHYATITDLQVGDKVGFHAATIFHADAIAMASTASFTDYANEAIRTSSDGEVSWFQYGGDTYAVENVAIGGGASPNDEDTFTNGADVIVRITGLVDLSDSSFSSAQNSLMVV